MELCINPWRVITSVDIRHLGCASAQRFEVSKCSGQWDYQPRESLILI